ncbi:MAG: GNAT family N-acetyltransferase [Lachnospiraceae bacterium]|nr:GNAT family N-acetyltransferase [Lachnospiraceae bacterium]
MNLIYKKLTPALCEEYISYFDNVAFSDHEEWAGCYCLESHLADEAQITNREDRRKKAEELIRSGILQGYLIYEGTHIVGWCNCNDKMNYSPIAENKEYQTDINESGKIKVLYCMDIAPAYRGRGLAHQTLDKVCEDAKSDGYLCIEAYPLLTKQDPYPYKGPISLYEAHGFTMYQQNSNSGFCIMRKIL